VLTPQRDAFEIPDDVAYLNCAYISPNLRAVREAGERAVVRKSRPWEITAEDFFTESEQVRGLFAAVVGGDADGVAIIPSASYGISTAAANIPCPPGSRIVVLAEQFPSNVYPWRNLADGHGTEVVTVTRPEDGPWTPAVLDAIDERTAVVAVPNCHWTDGREVDLPAVGAAAREVGAALVVDATQSLGAWRFDVAEVRPDYLVAAAYKWLLGPYSIGFMWVAEHRRSGTPLEHGWITRAGSEDFAGLVDYRDEHAHGARRYDVGERSNFALVPMAIAALRQVLDWEVEEITETISVHTDRIEKEAAALGLAPVPRESRAPHLLGIGLPGGVPRGLTDRLAAARVYVSVRGDSVRVSPHVWTTDRDVDRFLEVLASVL
jgi:selenocysteine lyase/cysteine desulfurase